MKHRQNVVVEDAASADLQSPNTTASPFFCVCVQLENFASNYNLGHAKGAVQQAIEQTQDNIQWVDKNKERILRWFEREAAS